MENLAIARTPELIAAEINGIKAQTRNLILYNQIEIGRKLTEAKSLLEHGEWGSWLKENVDYSKSTANNLMNLFDEYGSSQITLLSSNIENPIFEKLSYSQAVALLGLPEGDREAFVSENDVENMSTRELQKQIDALKSQLDDAEKTVGQKCDEVETLLDEKKSLLDEKKSADRVAQETVENLRNTLKKERDGFKTEKAELEKKIESAKASGNTEDVKALQTTLKELDAEYSKTKLRAEELEKQLKEQPIETAATIEVIPPEIEKELQELRGKQVDEAVIKFKLCFESVKKTVSDLALSLDDIKDPDVKEKYREAAKKFMQILQDKM